jgi:putative DNA-invertase from lambdoid prophage Rac
MHIAIYCRTSTSEQHPEKQINDCKKFAKDRGFDIEGIYLEKLSGYKDIKRPQYELIKNKAYKGEIKGVVVWAFDRWVRNRDTLLEDVTILKSYGCKIYSIKDQWLELINIEGAIGKTIQDFLLGISGSLAEMESQRKAERTKLAYQNHKGKWGRKSLSKRVRKDVLRLHEKKISMRDITKSVYYYDKNKNKKYLSIGAVHKIIKENKLEKDT